MKNNNVSSFILISGIIILIVFCSVAFYNIMPNGKESESLYAKTSKEINAKIDNLYITDENKLVIEVSGEVKQFCVKTTKTAPDTESICWKDFDTSPFEVSVYKYKKYYVWIKDVNNVISSVETINT